MLSTLLVLDLNSVTVNATTQVSIETNEEKSFIEKIKEKVEKRKGEKEKKKQVKEFKKKLKKAKKSLNKNKYADVLDILKAELNKDIDVSEAKQLCDMVEYYRGAKEDFENKKYELAKEKLNAIDSSYEDYKIKKDIDKLMGNIEEKLEYKEEINKKIDEIAILIDKKMTHSAKSKISELLNKDLDEEQKERLTESKNTVDMMIEEEKRLEEEKKRIEEEKKQEEEKKRAEEEKRRVEEEKRKQEEVRKQQEIANNKSTSNKTSSNSANSSGKTYYVAAGNRYYHSTPSCKHLGGAATTVTSNVSNKFPCNCVR